MAGFVSGESCLFVNIKKSKSHNLGFQVYLVFQIGQHSRDEQLMKGLINYFGCGNVYNKQNSVEFVVTKFKDITEIIIPFFDKYPIVGVKAKDFEDFKRVAELMKNKANLTPEGLETIRLIKMGMNRGRK